MHDIIKRYAKAGKVGLINPVTLFAYRNMPHRVREAAVYGLLAARRNKLPENRFMIFGQGRTGSTLLVDLLNSHPEVFTFGEILQQHVVTNTVSPRWWVEGLCTLSRKPTVGFKVKISQISVAQRKDPATTLVDFADHGWKIIHLKRTNLLRHAVSDLRSEKTGHYHTVKGDDITRAGGKKRKTVRIEWGELEKSMVYREDCKKWERDALANVPHVTVEYESDLSNAEQQKRSMLEVFDFIGVPPVEAETDFKKVTSRALADEIENFDELVPKIQSSRFAQFLES